MSNKDDKKKKTTKAVPKPAPKKPAPKPSSGKNENYTDVNDSQKSLTDYDYPYWNNIKNPTQLGMSDKGTFDVMSKDINGIKNDEILKTCIDVFDNLDNFVFTNPFESVKNNSNLIS